MNRRALLALVCTVIVVAGAAGAYLLTTGSPEPAVSPAEPVAETVRPQATEGAAAAVRPAEAEAAARPSPAPGGGASSSEKYGDWTVSCTDAGPTKRCSFGQGLFAAATGQRVLSLELVPVAGEDDMRGTLIAPLGLSFARGATLSVDAQQLLGPLPFVTCLQQGCIVPVRLEAAALTALGAGEKLTLSAVAVNGERPISFDLALDGFAEAAERTTALAQ